MRITCVLLGLLLPLALPLLAESLSPVAEMNSYLSKARDAVDSNHLAEAITSFVTVLALAEESPSSEGRDKAQTAAAELARIGTRLSLEPAGEWLDPKGSQIAASARQLGTVGGISPSVYLFENFGTGKSPVADAPIHFQFVKNSGSLVAFVTTDAYGKANTNVAKLDQGGSMAVIRAYPVFKARGKAYAFQTVSRDFAYIPPSNVMRVLALESSEFGTSDNPRTADVAAQVLKQTGLQVQPSNAKLADADFRRAYAGDAKSLAALGVDASSPYAGLILVEVAPARQMELNGKKYNIYTAVAGLKFRLIRSDGSAVFSLPLDGFKGQGASKEVAIADAYRRVAESLGSELQKRLEDIRNSLTKD